MLSGLYESEEIIIFDRIPILIVKPLVHHHPAKPIHTLCVFVDVTDLVVASHPLELLTLPCLSPSVQTLPVLKPKGPCLALSSQILQEWVGDLTRLSVPLVQFILPHIPLFWTKSKVLTFLHGCIP